MCIKTGTFLSLLKLTYITIKLFQLSLPSLKILFLSDCQTFSRMVTELSETLCLGLLKWDLTASSSLDSVLPSVPLIGLYLYTIQRHEEDIKFTLNRTFFSVNIQCLNHCLNSYYYTHGKIMNISGFKSSLKYFQS